MMSWLVFAVIALCIGVLLHLLGRRERVLTPIAFFVGLEILATWPALAFAAEEGSLRQGWSLVLLAAAGTLTAVIAYIVCGGLKPDALRWRAGGDAPDPVELRQVGQGLAILVVLLVGLSLWRYRGLPPLLHGGFSALVDPVGNVDQVSQIRESRRMMTKGYLMGQGYAGQGILNAVTEVWWMIAVLAAVLRHTWIRTSVSLWQTIGIGLLAFLFLGSGGQRGPLIVAGLAAAGAVALRYRVNWKQVLAIGIAVFAFMLFISPLSKGAEDGGSSLASRQGAVIKRITEGNGRNNVAIVRLVESGALPVGHGSVTMERLVVMIPGVPSGEPFALKVTRLAYGAGRNTTGFSTPTQFGVLYADGRDVGVILGNALVGAFMAVMWRILTRFRSFLGAVVVVAGAIQLGYMSVDSITGFISAAIVSSGALLVLFGPRILDQALAEKKVGEKVNAP